MMMMRRHAALIVMAATLTLGVNGSLAATPIFTDVTTGHWAQGDISTMGGLNVMNAYNDGLFHPDAWVTRPEFLNMTARTLGLPPAQITQIPSMNDLSVNAWGFDAVDNPAWISAYPAGIIRPENPVRRAEALAALSGTLNRPLVSSAQAEQILSSFKDGAMVPANLRQPVATAIEYNLFANDPLEADLIQPLEPASRADTAAMLNHLYANRSIAVVQNGALISPIPQQSVTAATRTSAVRTCPGTATSTTTGTCAAATTSQTRSSNVRNVPDEGTASDREAFTEMPWGSTAYRSSADTIEPLRKPGIHPETGIQPLKSVDLPANTTFTGTVAKAVYSEYNRPGDPVMLILDKTLMDSAGKIAAPAGSRVLGRVISVVPNNTSGNNAELTLRFHEILTPTGERLSIDAGVANADGVIRSISPDGVIFSPERSTVALAREISASEGSWYGTKLGKMHVLETPLVTLGDDRPLGGLDQRTTPNVVIGVGDRLQLKVGMANNCASPAQGSQSGAQCP